MRFQNLRVVHFPHGGEGRRLARLPRNPSPGIEARLCREHSSMVSYDSSSEVTHLLQPHDVGMTQHFHALYLVVQHAHGRRMVLDTRKINLTVGRCALALGGRGEGGGRHKTLRCCRATKSTKVRTRHNMLSRTLFGGARVLRVLLLLIGST